jgi:hypothetical protein
MTGWIVLALAMVFAYVVWAVIFYCFGWCRAWLHVLPYAFILTLIYLVEGLALDAVLFWGAAAITLHVAAILQARDLKNPKDVG